MDDDAMRKLLGTDPSSIICTHADTPAVTVEEIMEACRAAEAMMRSFPPIPWQMEPLPTIDWSMATSMGPAIPPSAMFIAGIAEEGDWPILGPDGKPQKNGE